MARLRNRRSRPRRRFEAVRDFFADLAYGTRRALRRAGGAIGGAIGAVWFRLPLRVRQGAAIAILAIGALALVRYAPIPRVPCEIGAAECAPADDAAQLVPGDAGLYVHLNLHAGSSQYRKAADLLGRLPDPQLVTQTVSGLVPHRGARFDLRRDVGPWVGGEIATAIEPSRQVEYLFSVADRGRAEEFLSKFAAKPGPTFEYRGTEVTTYPGSTTWGASAFVGGFLVLGDTATVRRAIDLDDGRGTSLADSKAARRVRDLLPEQRAADLYVSEAAARTLASAGGVAQQLDTFVDYSASQGFAAAAVAHGAGMEIELFSLLDRRATGRRPSFFAAFPPFQPSAAGELNPDAIAYLGIADPARSAGRLLEQASRADPQLVRSFERFSRRLQSSGGLDPRKQLVDLLRGEAAITVDPPPPAPHVTLVVDGVDQDKAITALARLQRPIADAINPGRTLQAPVFREQSIGGVTARSLRLSPTVELTYATFKGKLVVSTDPSGVRQVITGDQGLSHTALYKQTTGELPDRASAVVFVNLDQLFALAEQAGLAANPDYATFRDDIRAVKALALGVRGSSTELDTNLFLNIEEKK